MPDDTTEATDAAAETPNNERDTETFQRQPLEYANRAHEIRATAVAALKSAIPELRVLGVAQIVWHYDGSGDEGDIHQIEVCLRDTPAHVTQAFDSWRATLPTIVRDVLDPALNTDHVYNILPSGFEDNDGGYGMLTLDVEHGTLELEDNERYTEYNTTTTTM